MALARKLHLIRHAAVVVDRDKRATDWSLAFNAKDDIRRLLCSLDLSRIQRVITSQEKKAQQTGQLLADILHLRWETRPGLEEHHRSDHDFLDNDAFQSVVANFFRRPSEHVFGDECASAALKRFDAAIQEIMCERDDDELIVSHGRVISLFLARRQKADPMEIWSSLKQPDHIAIDWPRPLPAFV